MTSNGSYATGSFRTGEPASLPELGGMASAAHEALASALAGCAAFIAGLGDSFVRAIKIRRTYMKLAELDDHMLKDIGISRSEIGAVAVHSADFPDTPYNRRAS